MDLLYYYVSSKDTPYHNTVVSMIDNKLSEIFTYQKMKNNNNKKKRIKFHEYISKLFITKDKKNRKKIKQK